MKLKDARLCIDCEEIYSTGNQCPSCCSQAFILISNYIPTMAHFDKHNLTITINQTKKQEVTPEIAV